MVNHYFEHPSSLKGEIQGTEPIFKKPFVRQSFIYATKFEFKDHNILCSGEILKLAVKHTLWLKNFSPTTTTSSKFFQNHLPIFKIESDKRYYGFLAILRVDSPRQNFLARPVTP
jgi:hypothetical protein